MSNALENGNCHSVSYDVIRQAMNGEPYHMILVGEDAECVMTAVNQGIDAHLEACYIPDRGDSYTHDKFGKLCCVVSPESLPTLLRRLFEMDREESSRLADDVLVTLGFDDQGVFLGRDE